MTIHKERSYLQKHRFLPRQIHHAPLQALEMIIVIPCHNEFKLIRTLDSLEMCDPVECKVEVIIVINAGSNHAADIHQQNINTHLLVKQWVNAQPREHSYYCMYIDDLPQKHAGVGLARKIGMDEAVDRFEQIEEPKGIIVCLDADCLVATNYLKEIYLHFLHHTTTMACGIYFEHPINGNEYPHKVYQGIICYELFLRYYIQALRCIDFPHAFHTIGSSMAVLSWAYQQKGGMNRRKAGEDFYFLHKFIPDGTFTELNSTTVFPSPRVSTKVPFGTGRAIDQWLKGEKNLQLGYSFKSFLALQSLLIQVPSLYDRSPTRLHPAIDQFLIEHHFEDVLKEIRKHVASRQSFLKRFYTWLDAFKVLKFIHFARDEYFPDEPLLEVVNELVLYSGKEQNNPSSPEDWLCYFRHWQKNNGG